MINLLVGFTKIYNKQKVSYFTTIYIYIHFTTQYCSSIINDDTKIAF